MTQPEQKVRELEVFRRFVRASVRLIRRKSIRQEEPPRPDIVCKPLFRPEVGYELVEVLDQDMARRLGSALDAKSGLYDTYLALPKGDRLPLQRRSILVTFNDKASKTQRRSAAPDVLAAVGSSPPDYKGKLPVPPNLTTVVKWIDLRPNDLPHPLLEVSSSSTYGDPVLERIERKFSKTYDFSGPLELVAYYDLQDSLPIELQRGSLTKFLQRSLAGSPFRRVWVYGHREGRVLMALPAWGCLGWRVLRRRL